LRPFERGAVARLPFGMAEPLQVRRETLPKLLVPWSGTASTVRGDGHAGPALSPGTEDHVKKDKEDRKRLTLNRETIQRLEDSQLLEQVRGGTSQWGGCTITRTGFNNNEISSAC
jgi:hypothetical protein